MIISLKKSSIVMNNNKKKSPVKGTLPGDFLSGEQYPTARCAGANLCQKKYIIIKNMFPFCINLIPLYLKLNLKI